MELNNYIEHTLLNSNATMTDIKRLCAEAVDNGFNAVCIPPFFVKAASQYLKDTSIKLTTVVGYPMGYHAVPVKVEEAKRAIDEGADEIEVVINTAAVKDSNWSHVRNDIDSVTTTARLKGKKIKIILEVSLLERAEIEQICTICSEFQVDAIKTSTGMQGKGTTLDDIAFLKQVVQSMDIVAAGGIHSNEFAMDLINAGAHRLGTSSGLKLVNSI